MGLLVLFLTLVPVSSRVFRKYCSAQVSYMILQRVSPVTHSIGNCLKRVIVIIASVIFFQNPMGRQNQIGAPHHGLRLPLSLDHQLLFPSTG